MELFENPKKLAKVRKKYYSLAKEENNILIIDGNRPKEVVSKEIFDKVVESELIPGLVKKL
jgi:thymidylate kinase